MLSLQHSLTAAVTVLFVAALAAALRPQSISARLLEVLARMGRAFDGPVSTPLWLGAALTVPVLLALGAPMPVLSIAGAAVLLATPIAWEAGAAQRRCWVFAVAFGCPQPMTSAALGATGLLLCFARA